MKNPVIRILDDRAKFPAVDRTQYVLKLLREIDVSFEGKRVADLGAGFGSISIALAKGGADVVAIDANEQQIEELKRRAATDGVKLEAYVGNLLEDLNFISDAELALMVGVVEYAGMWNDTDAVEDLQVKVLRTAYDSLRPDGTFVLCTKNRIWPFFAVSDVNTGMPLVNVLPRPLAEKVSQRLSGKPYRIYIHSPRKWQDLLEKAGFRQSEVYYPFLSYQFPIGVSRKPSFAEAAALPEPQGPQELARFTHGRFWKLKANAMALAHRIGIPLSQSVVIKAIK